MWIYVSFYVSHIWGVELQRYEIIFKKRLKISISDCLFVNKGVNSIRQSVWFELLTATSFQNRRFMCIPTKLALIFKKSPAFLPTQGSFWIFEWTGSEERSQRSKIDIGKKNPTKPANQNKNQKRRKVCSLYRND